MTRQELPPDGMRAAYLLVRSELRGMTWPAITGPVSAAALALQYQLERSQWLTPGNLLALQLRQLDALVRHAWLTVPFYRWHWHGAYNPEVSLTAQSFQRLPLLTREHLLHDFRELASNGLPAAHGAISERPDRDSAGARRMLETQLVVGWHRALTLREHLWHHRDFDGILAEIGTDVEEGEARGWGAATEMVAASGRSVFFGVGNRMDVQLEWLRRHDPDYLRTTSSNAAALARRAIAQGIRLTRLREVRTAGPADGETRALCRDAWGVPLTGAYETAEAACIALQCPDHHEHYHVQSECVLAEVLDAQEQACVPGSMGRIVATTLQNFAMPLVRCITGDLAEAGDGCPCGRGLPVLRRIRADGGSQPGRA